MFLTAREDTSGDGAIDQNDQLGYYVMDLAGTGQCLIPGMQAAQGAATHPLERKIAFLESIEDEMALVVLDGESGEAEVLASNLEGHPENLLWSPDGQWIALNSDTYLHVVYAGSGTDRPHYRIPATNIWFACCWSRPWDWSPDSQQLAFVGGGDDTAAIYRIKRDGSGLTLVTEILVHSILVMDVFRWPPDGSQIFITSYHRSWEEIQQQSWESTGPPPRPFDLYAVDLDTGSLTLLSGVPEYEICGLEWSPDGQTILYYSPCSGEIPETEFLLIDRDGSNHRRLFQDPYYIYSSGKWSPDGEWIAFQTFWETHDRIFVIRADGTDLRQLTDGCFPTFFQMWLPK